MALIQEQPLFSWGLFSLQMIIISSIFLWIYCLNHISKHKFKNNKKVIWVLVVIFLPLIGSILYLTLGKKDILADQ